MHRPSQALSIQVFKAGRAISSPVSIRGDSPKVREVMDFAMSDSRHWRTSLTSFAPGVSIHRDGFDLNVSRSGVVMNIAMPNERSRQYVGDVSAEDFDHLVKTLGMDPSSVGSL